MILRIEIAEIDAGYTLRLRVYGEAAPLGNGNFSIPVEACAAFTAQSVSDPAGQNLAIFGISVFGVHGD